MSTYFIGRDLVVFTKVLINITNINRSHENICFNIEVLLVIHLTKLTLRNTLDKDLLHVSSQFDD